MSSSPPSPFRRWLRYLGLLSLVCFALLLGVAWYFSSVMMYTSPPRCHKDSFFFCKTPKERGLSYEEIEFKSPDGTKLSGWWVPAPKASRVIVFSHGRGADRRAALRLMPSLHRAGFHVLAFDYRNCGKSDRSFNTMGGYERQDLHAAIDFVEKVKGLHRIGLYGFSLGAAIGIQVMARDQRVAAGIFEGGFADVKEVSAQRAKELYGLPRWPLLPFVFWFYSLRTGVKFSQLHPKDHIAKISPRPVFLIHGDADRVVRISHGKKLYQRAKEPKQLWVVPGGLHTRTWQQYRKEYEARVLGFYQKNIPIPTPAAQKSVDRQRTPAIAR